MNRYFKNFILCGDIDHHCLLCQETFQLITDIEKHVRWEKHRRNIKNHEYVPKLKKDLIYKLENSYYCETCNYVVPNLTAIQEHVRSDQHKTVKSKPESLIKKPIGHYDSGYVIIGKIILNKQQWHCIIDKKCLLCEVDVTNVDEHISSHDHIVKLIQCTTKCEGNRYYRKINYDTYQCYTCKKIFIGETFNEHWSTCENQDEIELKKLKEAGPSRRYGLVSEPTPKMADLEKKLVETLEEFFCIDEQKNVADCKFCKISVPINFVAMIEHMKNEHDGQDTKPKKKDSSESSEDEVVYREVADHGQRRAELSKYGKKHFIKLNFNGSKGFCTLCNRYISAHKTVFREHTRGTIHRGHLELKGLKKPKEHKPCEYQTEYLHLYPITFKYSPEIGAFWYQDSLSIDAHSFLLLYLIEKNPHYLKTKCYGCDELLPQGQEREHCMTLKHRASFVAAKFVMQDDEFIREVRSNLYHCATCNLLIPFWETVQTHIQTWKHIHYKVEKSATAKAADYWRNFGSTALEIRADASDDFYVQMMCHLFGYYEVFIN